MKIFMSATAGYLAITVNISTIVLLMIRCYGRLCGVSPRYDKCQVSSLCLPTQMMYRLRMQADLRLPIKQRRKSVVFML